MTRMQCEEACESNLLSVNLPFAHQATLQRCACSYNAGPRRPTCVRPAEGQVSSKAHWARYGSR